MTQITQLKEARGRKEIREKIKTNRKMMSMMMDMIKIHNMNHIIKIGKRNKIREVIEDIKIARVGVGVGVPVGVIEK